MPQVPSVDVDFVGDGSRTIFDFDFPYQSKNEIFVSVDEVDTPYVWVAGSTHSVEVTPAPARATHVRVYRSTAAYSPRHLFAAGTPFLPRYVDENATQLLYALQEGMGDFGDVRDTAEEALVGVGEAQAAAEAARQSAQAAAAATDRALRVSPLEPVLPVIPSVAERAGKVLGFNSQGNPVANIPASGSASELALDLASPTKGSRMVAFEPGLNVYDFLTGLRAANGAGMVGYGPGGGSIQDFLDLLRGATGVRTLADRMSDIINVKDYGLIDTPANTRATIMAAWTAATMQGKAMLFPAGKYTASSLPNLAASNLHIYCQGKVVLKTLGPGWALDLTANAANMFNFRIIGDMSIEGNATSTGGVHFQALNHSVLELRVYNVNGAAFQVNSGVLTKFKLTASINVGSSAEWAIVPTTGLIVDSRGGSAGDFASACWFDVRLGGVSGIGFDSVNMQQCSITGTSEHNGSFGIRTQIGSRYNNWNNLDLEQNLDNDIRIGGVCDTWMNIACRSTAVTNNIEVLSTAEGNTFISGDLRCANMNVGSWGTHFEACRFSDNGALGMKGAGVYTHNRCWRYNLANVRTASYTAQLGVRGTFLPSLVGESVSGALTYSTRVGRYSVVGDVLRFFIHVIVQTKDPAMAGRLLLTGIPIPSRADVVSAGVVGVHSNVVKPTEAVTGFGWRIGAGTATMTFPCPVWGGVPVDMTSSSIVAGSAITFSGSIPLSDLL